MICTRTAVAGCCSAVFIMVANAGQAEDARLYPARSDMSAECRALEAVALKPGGDAGYPPEAIRKRLVKGWVVLQYDVITGKPQNIEVVEAFPDPLFGRAATKVAREQLYQRGASAKGCFALFEYQLLLGRHGANGVEPVPGQEEASASQPDSRGYLGPTRITGMIVAR